MQKRGLFRSANKLRAGTRFPRPPANRHADMPRSTLSIQGDNQRPALVPQ